MREVRFELTREPRSERGMSAVCITPAGRDAGGGSRTLNETEAHSGLGAARFPVTPLQQTKPESRRRDSNPQPLAPKASASCRWATPGKTIRKLRARFELASAGLGDLRLIRLGHRSLFVKTPGEGFEPSSPVPKTGVLPVGRSRKSSSTTDEPGAIRTRVLNLRTVALSCPLSYGSLKAEAVRLELTRGDPGGLANRCPDHLGDASSKNDECGMMNDE
jgi:hypothetical protein